MNRSKVSTLCYPTPVPAVWRAHWIAPEGVAGARNAVFRVRTRFSVPRSGEPFSPLFIAADSRYRLFVNGIFVGAGAVRDTATRVFYDAWNIEPLLIPGSDNWIAVEVMCHNVPSFKFAPHQPAVLAQWGDGETLASGAHWETQVAPDFLPDAPVYTPQCGLSEERDARKEPLGWQTGDDVSREKWGEATLVSAAQSFGRKQLHPRDIPALTRCVIHPALPPVVCAFVPSAPNGTAADAAHRMSCEPHLLSPAVSRRTAAGDMFPFVVPMPGDGYDTALIWDFGQTVVGGFSLTIDAPAGTVLEVGYEEILLGDRLVVDQRNPPHWYRFTDRYILRHGQQVVENINERGFRFLQITVRNCAGNTPVTVHGLTGTDTRYPIPASAATFACDDSRLNALFAACAETLSACTTDTFTDCPWREAALWVNDLLVENVLWLRMFGDGRVAARSLRLAVSQARDEDGILPGVCPTDGSSIYVLAPTSLFFPCVLDEYVLYTGDAAIVPELLPALHRVFDTVRRWRNSDGVIVPPETFWNFVDWSYPSVGVFFDGRASSVVSFLYARGLAAMARLCERVGESEAAQSYHEAAREIVRAAHAAFWDATAKRYREFVDEAVPTLAGQLTHALAFLLSDEERGASPGQEIMEHCREALTDDALLTPELYLQHVVLRALARTGQYDAIWARIERYWLPMIAAGSTTIWEMNVHQHGKAAFNGTGSLCHGFACTPAEVLQAVLLGVTPLTDGYRTFRVAPEPLSRQWASGKVPTPHGSIAVSWTRRRRQNVGGAAQLILRLVVPEGCTAVVPTRGKDTYRGAGKHLLLVTATTKAAAATINHSRTLQPHRSRLPRGKRNSFHFPTASRAKP